MEKLKGSKLRCEEPYRYPYKAIGIGTNVL